MGNLPIIQYILDYTSCLFLFYKYTIINLNNESSIKFSTTKDLIENFTEFYNYIYTYETDCISLNLNYNKSYYQDGNLKPDESLSFLIKIIPFTELGVNNLGSFIKK